jgi:prepilin-type N-terminal cleavage/methylation domain-containing protein
MYRQNIRQPSRTERDRSGGFTLIELLVAVLIIGLLSTVAIASVQNAVRRARVSAVAAEGKVLLQAFATHYVDEGKYPNSSSTPNFQLDTFEPLRSMGYYRGDLASKLVGNRADSYDSPDDTGSNREFWLLMTPEGVPGVQVVVGHTKAAPFAGGEWIDGVYIIQNGVLIPADEYQP